MARRFTDIANRRFARWCLLAPALAGIPAIVAAQHCSQQLPEPKASFAEQTSATKFRLINGACPALLAPVRPLSSNADPQSAARPASGVSRVRALSVTIDMNSPSEAEQGTPAPMPLAIDSAGAQSPYESKSQRKREIRVLSLSAPMIDVARENDLDPLLLHAIAHVESRHNPLAVSHAGAQGVMQVMPATGKRFGAPARAGALLDINTNLRASANYLRMLSLRFQGDLKLMLAAYNAGEGAVDKAGGNIPPYPETQAYVRDVLRVYGRLAERFTVTETGRLQQRVQTGQWQP